MFGKLKEKLKSAMSVFSKKVEKESDLEKKSETKEIKLEVVDNVQKERSQRKIKEVKETKEVSEVKEAIKTIKKDERKEKNEGKKPKKEIDSETVLPDKTVLEKVFEEKAEIEAYEEKEETKPVDQRGFFGKLKDVFVKDGSKELDIPVQEKLEEKKSEDVTVKQEVQEDAEDQVRDEVKDQIKIKSFFGRVKESITTKKISAEKFEELFWDMEMILLENNVSVEVIEKMKQDLSRELVDKPLPRDVPKKIEETLRNTLTKILTYEKVNIIKNIKNKRPYVIAFFGVNGAGKTTSIAKLANFLKEKKLIVVLAACDTFRAAAIQQLQEHADKLALPMIKHDYGSDAAAVAFDAIKYAEKNKLDVVLIDTAGRLHSNTNLMAELSKIIKVTKPDLKLFIGESITGNDCIEQARKFNELVQMDGVILTKADVDDKGGAPLSISYTIGKPILFLGVGQGYNDFEEFDKDKILTRLGF